MRICIEKVSGNLIEMQSDATEGTLIRNALNAGYKEDEVEERLVTPEGWAIYETELRKPTPEQIEEAKIQAEMQRILRDQAIANLIAKGEIKP